MIFKMCGGFSFCFLTITVIWKRLVAITHNVWCFAKAGLRRTNVELTTKDN